MKDSLVLKIVAKEKNILTKNQQLFNKLTKSIVKLEAKIVDENDKLLRLLELYANKVRPLLSDNANLKLKLAISLADTNDRIKYTKKQKENIKDIIIDLCNDAFSDIEPNEEQEAFYDKWSQISYQDELKSQTEREKELLAHTINSTFGIDLNMDEFDDSAEGMAKLQSKLREEFEKSQEKDSKSKIKKKTKKQIQNEQDLEEKEEIKNKSVRSIYISLVKVLHPDSETDIKLKYEKEEIMKKVTLAYEKKDLPTLLKLEMEWVFKETEQLDKITDDKLKIYISVLNERINELNKELFMTLSHPKFSEISDFSHVPEVVGDKGIKSQIKQQRRENKELNNSIKLIETSTDKKNIMDFIDDYVDNLSGFDMSDFLDYF